MYDFTDQDMAEAIAGAVEATSESGEFDSQVTGTRSFRDAGVLTYNDGFVLTLDDGSEFQVTVQRSRR